MSERCTQRISGNATVYIHKANDWLKNLIFFPGLANFKLICEAKSGKAGSQLIPDEATLQCKSSSEAENKVLISIC